MYCTFCTMCYMCILFVGICFMNNINLFYQVFIEPCAHEFIMHFTLFYGSIILSSHNCVAKKERSTYLNNRLVGRLQLHCNSILTGKYRELQGNPCNEKRDPTMRTGIPCNKNRFFPKGIDLQGVPCKPYRVWVYSVRLHIL